MKTETLQMLKNETENLLEYLNESLANGSRQSLIRHTIKVLTELVEEDPVETLKDLNDESDSELVEDELLAFNELGKDAQQRALFDFCKYNLLYTTPFGEVVEADADDYQVPALKRAIIKSIKTCGMRFYEDGSHF